LAAAGAETVDPEPPSRRREGWVGEQFAAHELSVDGPARARVAEQLGEGTGAIVELVERLVGVYGPGARLGLEEVEAFLGEAGGVPPWELTDAIDRGDTALALDRLHRTLRGGGRHPLEVIASLRRHYTRMLRLDGAGARGEKEAAAVLGIRGSTFPAGKALTQVQRLGHRGVRRAVILLATADLDLHGAQAWPDELVMEVLVARLSKLAAARPS
jgi:DNA polymerase-3 subunit delta